MMGQMEQPAETDAASVVAMQTLAGDITAAAPAPAAVAAEPLDLKIQVQEPVKEKVAAVVSAPKTEPKKVEQKTVAPTAKPIEAKAEKPIKN